MCLIIMRSIHFPAAAAAARQRKAGKAAITAAVDHRHTVIAYSKVIVDLSILRVYRVYCFIVFLLF